MNQEIKTYQNAVEIIKTAILQSQARAAKAVNQEQLALYFGIGRYVSANTRKKNWGQGAIEAISNQLKQELPGLRGFSAPSLRKMRIFYEEWSMLERNSFVPTNKLDSLPEKTFVATNKFTEINTESSVVTDEMGQAIVNSAVATAEFEDDREIRQLRLANLPDFPLREFLSISFTHHIAILAKAKAYEERIFYMKYADTYKPTVEDLEKAIMHDLYHHQDKMPNNFLATIPDYKQAYRAIRMFKDEYLLDFINIEDPEDTDERVIEQSIIQNIKNFIMAFGKDFAFMGNQYHLEVDGHDYYIDLLFFSRKLHSLVAFELKRGEFKPEYTGKLNFYLSALDEYVKLPDENPSIGIILCKSKSDKIVELSFRDTSKPMGEATYRTSKELPKELRDALPDMEELKKLL